MKKKKKYPHGTPKPWYDRQFRRDCVRLATRLTETEQERARREEIARLKRIYPPRPYMKVTRLRDQHAAQQREKARQSARERRERTASKTDTRPPKTHHLRND